YFFLKGEKELPYDFAIAERGSLTQEVSVTGRVQPSESVDLAFEKTGKIVNERTGEIGLRKAVGANYSDIMRQFLSESVLITLLGGIAGTILGVLISYFIYLGASSFGFDWVFAVPLKAFITAILFSIVSGIIFGVYPARKAAHMDPVVALTRE
ncbi:FtsX-like permease family protein, partial [Patescibacteria group bacterium]|nr:FtsX-like permease family protein [Patescibacteria group bacterium]